MSSSRVIDIILYAKKFICIFSSFLFQGKLFDIEIDFKGDPMGVHITHCK